MAGDSAEVFSSRLALDSSTTSSATMPQCASQAAAEPVPGGADRLSLVCGLSMRGSSIRCVLQSAWIAHGLVRLVSKLRRIRANLAPQRRVRPGLGFLFGQAKLQGGPVCVQPGGRGAAYARIGAHLTEGFDQPTVSECIEWADVRKECWHLLLFGRGAVIEGDQGRSRQGI